MGLFGVYPSNNKQNKLSNSYSRTPTPVCLSASVGLVRTACSNGPRKKALKPQVLCYVKLRLEMLTNGLSRECIHKLNDILYWDVVSPENASTHANAILPCRRPVEFLHAAIPNQRCIQSGEVVASDYNRNASIFVLVVHSRELDVGRVISNVHECRVHHLVVYSVLGSSSHSSCSCVEIVDEKAAHLPFGDDVSRLAVSLPDQLCRLSCVSALQFSGAHHDWAINGSNVKDEFFLEIVSNNHKRI